MKTLQKQTYKVPASLSDIDENVITSVYRESDSTIAQTITSLCLSASDKELSALFKKLHPDTRLELANILCHETASMQRRFTLKKMNSSSKALCKVGVEVIRFKTEPVYISIPEVRFYAVERAP